LTSSRRRSRSPRVRARQQPPPRGAALLTQTSMSSVRSDRPHLSSPCLPTAHSLRPSARHAARCLPLSPPATMRRLPWPHQPPMPRACCATAPRPEPPELHRPRQAADRRSLPAVAAKPRRRPSLHVELRPVQTAVRTSPPAAYKRRNPSLAREFPLLPPRLPVLLADELPLPLTSAAICGHHRASLAPLQLPKRPVLLHYRSVRRSRGREGRLRPSPWRPLSGHLRPRFLHKTGPK